MAKLLFFLFTISGAFPISCNFTITTLNFGTYDPSNKNPTDSTAALTISCNGNKPINYSITCDQGMGINSSVNGGRRLTALPSKSILTYNLFTDNYYVNILGDGVSGNAIEGETVSTEPGSTEATKTIYGRIPPKQDSDSGTYTDTIRVTVVVNG